MRSSSSQASDPGVPEAVAFSHQNSVFARKCSDPALFGYDGFNFIKLVQHALIYAEGKKESRIIRNYFSMPYPLMLCVYSMRWLRDALTGRGKNAPELKPVVFIDNGRERYDAEGNVVSAYYHRITGAFPRASRSVLMKRNARRFKHWDHDLSELKTRMRAGTDRGTRRVLRAMKQVQRQISRSGKFSAYEQFHTRIFFHLFFEDLLFYNSLLKDSGVRTCFFDTHYFNEGLICALRLHGAKAVEIQHGLIAETDTYYVYPSFITAVRNEAFFPDRLIVYGPFWKDKVLKGGEHTAGTVLVGGNYLYNNERPPALPAKDNLIFIGVQKRMHGQFVPYISNLAEMLRQKHRGWRLLVKLHPLEKYPEMYAPLARLENVSLAGNRDDLMSLLGRSRIQVSYYSTTFYDAVGLDVMNFSLQDDSPFSDYAAEMIRDGIAQALRPDEDPVDKYLAAGERGAQVKRESIYAPFDQEIFLLEADLA